MRSTKVHILLLALASSIALLPAPARAQATYVDPYRFWKWPVQDGAAFVDVLTSDEALYAAAAGALLLTLAPHDGELAEDLRALYPPGRDLTVKTIEELGNVKAVRPLALLIFAGSLMTEDRRFQDAAFTSLESVIIANLVTSSLKTIVGRARPYQGEGPTVFKPFSGNTSFPSGHATTAFAFVTPWMLYYPNAVTPALLILSVGTALTRVVAEYHWTTDIIAGSAIGFSTAYWLTRRHQAQSGRVLLAPTVSATEMGVRLQIRLDP